MTQPIRSMPEMIEAYRERIRELGLTHQTVDQIAGWADGYCSKLMCGMKQLGPKSIPLLNGALAMGFVVQVDPEQSKRVERRWVKRVRPLRELPLLAPALSIENEVPRIIEITPDLQAQLERKTRMKMLGSLGGKAGGSKGGKRRLKTMGKRARQRAASHAARMRWDKVQAEIVDSPR